MSGESLEKDRAAARRTVFIDNGQPVEYAKVWSGTYPLAITVVK